MFWLYSDSSYLFTIKHQKKYTFTTVAYTTSGIHRAVSQPAKLSVEPN